MILCIEGGCYENSFEFINGDFISSLITTLIGTFVGFFLAILAERQIESKKQKEREEEENKRILRHLKYLQTILTSLVDIVPQQIEEYKKYAEEIKSDPLELHKPRIVATFDLLRLRNADNVETQSAYYHYMKETENIYADYKSIFGNGDFLFRIFDSAEQQTVRATNFKHKRQYEIRDLIEELSLKLGLRAERIKSEHKGQGVPPEEYSYIINLSNEYSRIINKPLNFKDVKDNFVAPLFFGCRSIIKDESVMEEIFRMARRAHGLLVEIEGNAIEHAGEMIELEVEVENGCNNLKDLLKKINTTIENNVKTNR